MSDKKLDLIITKLEGMEEDISGLKTEMHEVKSEVSGLKTEMNEVKSAVSGLKTEMHEVKGEVSSLKSQMNGMQDEITVMKSQLEENTHITKAIHHRQSESDARLEGLSLDFAKLHGEVVSTKENIEQLIDDQRSIHELLGEHEVSIRTLRRKPV